MALQIYKFGDIPPEEEELIFIFDRGRGGCAGGLVKTVAVVQDQEAGVGGDGGGCASGAATTDGLAQRHLELLAAAEVPDSDAKQRLKHKHARSCTSPRHPNKSSSRPHL